MKSTNTISNETLLIKHNTIYIENVLSLNRKEFNKYIVNYKKYFIIIIDKLRSEIIEFIIYV